MDGRRFDDLTRDLAAARTRRGFLGGLIGVAAGLVGLGRAAAGEICPPEQVFRKKTGCVCESTGRPPTPAGASCPCRSGWTRCAGLCRNLATDPSHCGACGTACPVDSGVTQVACRQGVCRITACAAGLADCDRNPATGCETPLGTETDCTACGDTCTGSTPVCLAGVGCVACIAPGDCPAPPNGCLVNTCVGNVCGTQPANEGEACGVGGICCGGTCYPGDCCIHADCNDDNACTTETCVDHRCVFSPVDCDDDNACTTDSCNPLTGCVHTPVTCNDNNACTTDTCNPSIGCVHTPMTCDDGNPCTSSSCNPATGCVHTPLPNGPAGTCTGSQTCCGGTCTQLGTTSNCTACGQVCSGDTPFCQAGVGCGECQQARDCGDPCVVNCVSGACVSTPALGNGAVCGADSNRNQCTCRTSTDDVTACSGTGGGIYCSPAQTCTSSSDCRFGESFECINGECGYPCESDDDCGGERCHPTKGYCVACLGDAECVPRAGGQPALCLTDNACIGGTGCVPIC